MAAIFWAAVALAGCGGSPGYIRGAQPDALFVKTAERHYAYSASRNRWLVVGLDGQVLRRLFDGKYSIADVSQDGQVFVLSNSHTDLFLGFDGGTRIVGVPAFHGRLGIVAVSPDGRRVAATKHPDFSLPQKQWVEDDTVYLLDTKTLRSRKVTQYTNNNNRGAFSLLWLDDRTVRLQIIGGPIQTIDVANGKHRAFPDSRDPLNDSPRWKTRDRRADSCGISVVPKGWRGDRGFEIHQKGKAPRHLVVVEGRERGFHDYMATISGEFLTRDCRYVVFHFDNGLWIADVATGKVGPIAPASERPMLFRRWYPIGLP